jgi:ABC-type transporter Mla subunit MlaD
VAKRRATPKELPDAVREAVDRTVQATRGSAVQTRDRAQGAVDDLVDTVDDLVKEAEGRIVRGGRAAARAIDDVRPVTNDDLRDLKAELRKISRRLDAIEERLPAKKAPARKAPAKRSGTAKTKRK